MKLRPAPIGFRNEEEDEEEEDEEEEEEDKGEVLNLGGEFERVLEEMEGE